MPQTGVTGRVIASPLSTSQQVTARRAVAARGSRDTSEQELSNMSPPSSPPRPSDQDRLLSAAAGSSDAADVEGQPGSPQQLLQHQESGQPPVQQLLSGQLLVLLSALLWGTSAPAMRYLYRQGEGLAPSPSVVAAIQTLGGAICLVLIEQVLALRNGGSRTALQPQRSKPSGDAEGLSPKDLLGQAPLETAPPALPPRERQGERQEPGPGGLLARLAGMAASDIRLAGAELGVWAFLANAATVVGFATTSVVRGAFLIRLSAMFTPALAALGGERFSPAVWMGCTAALVGGILIASDNSGATAGSAEHAQGLLQSLSWGDGIIVVAALLWSVQTVRLGRHAPRFPSTRLAAWQLSTMGLLSGFWAAGDAAAALTQHHSVTSVWGGANRAVNWAVMLVPALGPWSIGTALQMKGQTRISAPVAMIILATDPIWAALLAGLVDPSEQHLGMIGWFGAAAIFSASIIASRG